MTRSKQFTFTSFQSIPPLFTGNMRYLLYAPEFTEKEQHHWQGFVIWTDAKTISASSKCLGKIAVKMMAENATIEDNQTYIKGPYSKGDKFKPANPDFKEFGKVPEQGKRTDLFELRDEIMNGKSVNEITLENPNIYHQYGRTIEKLESIYLNKKIRKEMTTCDWYYGDTGTGKSHIAFTDYFNFEDPKSYYLHDTNDKGWWDHYSQQEYVVINEFRGEIPLKNLLDLIDKWPCKVPRRNVGTVNFTSKHIIITSSKSPSGCYPNCDDRIEQLLDRIKIIHLEGKSKRTKE